MAKSFTEVTLKGGSRTIKATRDAEGGREGHVLGQGTEEGEGDQAPQAGKRSLTIKRLKRGQLQGDRRAPQDNFDKKTTKKARDRTLSPQARRRRCWRSRRWRSRLPGDGEREDPGRWIVTGATHGPIEYFQGLTSEPGESTVHFVGLFQGLWKTTPWLHHTLGVPSGDPAVRRARPRGTTTSAIRPGTGPRAGG